MSGTTMVFLIVLVAVASGVIRSVFHKYLEVKKLSSATDAETQALKEEVATLKKRVVTLEKIVTDEGYQVKKEFDRL